MVIPAGQHSADQLAAAEKAAEIAAAEEPQIAAADRREDMKVDMPDSNAAREPIASTVAPPPTPTREAKPEPAAHTETSAGVDPRPAPNPLPLAKLQVLSGSFAGRELELTKALTTLGRPGVQVAAITQRAEGYFIVHVESSEEGDYLLVNGQPIGAQASKWDSLKADFPLRVSTGNAHRINSRSAYGPISLFVEDRRFAMSDTRDQLISRCSNSFRNSLDWQCVSP